MKTESMMKELQEIGWVECENYHCYKMEWVVNNFPFQNMARPIRDVYDEEVGNGNIK